MCEARWAFKKHNSMESRRMSSSYDKFRVIHQSCWACGSTRKPDWWHGIWLPNERAHIVNQPRVDDVRVIVCLCSTCHKIQTNSTFPELGKVPQLSLANLLFLKIANDPSNYDPAFILRHSVRNVLPTPEPLPKWYRDQLDGRTADSIVNKF